MTALSFGDPGESRYEVYKGQLGQAIIVRMNDRLIGIAQDRTKALTLVRSDIARRRREKRDAFFFAA